MSDIEWEAVRLTLLVSLTAVVLALPPAIALGWCLARKSFPGKAVIEVVLNLPLVLPPVVTGYLLLITFGRRGLLGAVLEGWLGVRFIFDWKGAALAAAIVGFPLFVRPIRLAFASIDSKLLQAARTLGASRSDAFLSIALPLAAPGIVSGAVLAFARGLGEFGATIMIAGSIPGETQTISLLIYSLLEAPGGMRRAVPLVLTAVVIAAMALLAGELLDRAQRRRLEGSGA